MLWEHEPKVRSREEMLSNTSLKKTLRRKEGEITCPVPHLKCKLYVPAQLLST